MSTEGTSHLLTRSRSSKVIAGVAGGLGRFLRVDPVVLRIAFVILGVMGLISAGFLLFILLTSNPFLRLTPVPLDGNMTRGAFGFEAHPRFAERLHDANLEEVS